jgi:hypothetical protein
VRLKFKFKNKRSASCGAAARVGGIAQRRLHFRRVAESVFEFQIGRGGGNGRFFGGKCVGVGEGGAWGWEAFAELFLERCDAGAWLGGFVRECG